MSLLRTCIDCGAVTRNTRCGDCSRDARQHYTGQWKQLAAAAVDAHPWCTWCGATEDLCADHIIPGDPTALQVLCRPCNTKRRNGATGP